MSARNPEGTFMNLEGGSMNPEAKVQNAVRVFVDLYRGDGDLVREGARHHDVQVVERDIFDALSDGNYNFRIPRKFDNESIKKLIGASRVAWVCEDYRQAAQVADALGLRPEGGKEAVFGIAGGAAQPEEKRFKALADLIAVLSQANPEMEHYLVIHDGVCGGANHYTGGEMKRVREQQGAREEQTKMIEFRTKLVNVLVERGVNPDKIKVGLAVVENDKFVELK